MGWPLTFAQKVVLQALKENDGVWYPGCGWYYQDVKTTAKILDDLCSKGILSSADNRLYFKVLHIPPRYDEQLNQPT